MRAIVTGGLGFIGSVVVEQLVAAGHEVVVVDDGRSPCIEFEQLPPGVTWVNLPAANAAPLLGSSPSWRCDLVVHAASPVGAVGVLDQFGKIAEQIVGTTAAIAAGCLRANARLVNLSTSEVYGFSGVYAEADDCVVPARRNARMEYGVGKLAAEFAIAGAVERGLKAVTVRPFNVAGARQDSDKGFVLPTFVERALDSQPIPVFGDGTQERSLTAVSDVADFITGAWLGDARWQGEVYNVGNPANQTSIQGLAERVIELAGSTSPIYYTSGADFYSRPDYDEALGHVKVPVIEHALSLGWRPRVALDDLILSVIDDLS